MAPVSWQGCPPLRAVRLTASQCPPDVCVQSCMWRPTASLPVPALPLSPPYGSPGSPRSDALRVERALLGSASVSRGCAMRAPAETGGAVHHGYPDKGGCCWLRCTACSSADHQAVCAGRSCGQSLVELTRRVERKLEFVEVACKPANIYTVTPLQGACLARGTTL